MAKKEKPWEVVVYNMNNPSETQTLLVNAVSQEDAEKAAISGGIINLQNGWGVLNSTPLNKQQKHVYRVTFYYHSNCDVLVESDEPLSREDAIDKAYHYVGNEKYQKQIAEGLIEVDTPDCAEEDAGMYAFDRNGKIIRLGDNVVFYQRTWDYWNSGTVKTITVTPKSAKVIVAVGGENITANAKDCVVYE